MQDNLPELRDIHLPESIPAFPPAYGWWVILAGIIFLAFLYVLFRKYRKRSKKQYALSLLEAYGVDTVAAAAGMSEILRRICLIKYKEAAALFGNEWIDFLNRHCRKKLSGKAAELLINAPYLNKNAHTYEPREIRELRNFCISWIGENL